jgi:Mg2+-importing ATPase
MNLVTLPFTGTHAPAPVPDGLRAYWSTPVAELIERIESSPDGLGEREASARLRRDGANLIAQPRSVSSTRLLLRQLGSPLLLLLVFAAAASAVTSAWMDATIVFAIVVVTVAIGYSREYRAEAAAEALRARVRTSSRVYRGGRLTTVANAELVPGDVVMLTAGVLVPADGVLLDASDLHVSEAVLTGESFPARKQPGVVAAAATLRERDNCVFAGTNVRSGRGRVLIVRTGSSTALGHVAHRLTASPPETEFDRGIRHFGYLLTTAMTLIVVAVFTTQMLRGQPPVSTLLFAIALAVGLSPELLPVILSVNLARAAEMMARRGVLVRRLTAIENLGSMDVLCTDKTGTLTEGVVRLDGAYAPDGEASAAVLLAAAHNAALETGVASPLDDAITAACSPDLGPLRKRGEVPFDFVRKRVTVAIETEGRVRLVTKGAFHEVLAISNSAAGLGPIDAGVREQLERRYETWTGQGLRVLAVAEREADEQPTYGRDDERGLTFLGFLTFLDRPREGVRDTIQELARLGVTTKLITGDSGLVARYVAGLVGIRADRTLTGHQLDDLADEALPVAAAATDLFVEVDPNQKERIILALKKHGHVVGFLGDGVNDAPAMHAADTSLSVEEAVDVAREAADFVLLERGLDVIRRGIEEGRKTFANTLKYILITTSANLGNMVSMAAASVVLPFLPLTAGQILLNNLLSDIPAVGLASDRVDPELVERPQRWHMAFIGRYMLQFGMLSSLFDMLTFGLLIWVLQATPLLFRTAWFVESLLTELVVCLVVRTRRPFVRSRPGGVLAITTFAVIAVALVLPYLPFSMVFGLVPLPLPLVAAVVVITLLYAGATEALKLWFFRAAGARPTHD